MSTFTSENYCTSTDTTFEGLFEHDRGTEQVVVKDTLITDVTVATARAKAELLKGGYVERWVSISSIHISNLKQNDIITFKGVNWIVKEVTLSFQSPRLIQVIKGVRYE